MADHGDALLIVGEPGVGKTALLQYLMESASGMTVLRAVGVESEIELAYAGLHQLCAPVLDRLERLPAPQRDALRVVFGVTSGTPPDRFLVSLGLLSLLSEVAEECPVLCVVDDAQWLDEASALTLAFVARRLLAERVGIVFATREPGEELRHLRGLEVRGLGDSDARALLGMAVRFMLDERVLERIIAEARGNPLALLELPRGLTASEPAVGLGPVDAQLPKRIEESFIRLLETLSEDARRLLLLAAAEPVGDPVLLWRAVAQLGIEAEAADRAENEGLLTIGERVTFRHPLVRSAVYGSASPEDRRAVHLALAEVTDREADPDRRAWHLAVATTEPDEQVAAELERSADRARARAGVAAAGAFLKRSVSLTLDPARRAERALAAAQAHLQAGAFDTALRLVACAEEGTLDELGAARVELLRGQLAFATSLGGEGPALLLLKAARRIEPLDITLARETYLDAWVAAMFASRFARVGTLHEVSWAAISAAQPISAPCPSDLLLNGFSVLISEGRAAAASKLSRAVSVFAHGEIAMAERLRWGWLGSTAAGVLWDEEGYWAVNNRQVQSVREAGLLGHLPIYLQALGSVAAMRGDFAMAGSLIEEADAIAETTETRLVRAAAVILAGLRGKEAEASAAIEVEVRNCSAAESGMGVQTCQWVSAILYNGLGCYERALAEARQASEEAPELPVSGWALAELIEAAVRVGETRVAVEALERLVEAASAGGTDWGSGVLARSRALLSEGDDAESSYREGIERLSRTQLRPELARAHLLYGEWLRSEKRRLDAREQLRSAHELFTSIGMEAFAERARGELRATGEHVCAHTVEAREDLTAQEQQIAELARDGLSNPEIGARLFLSPRTVEWHLRHVFGKLGIKSRRDLPSALPSSESRLVTV